MLYFDKLVYAKRPDKTIPDGPSLPTRPDINPDPTRPSPGRIDPGKNDPSRIDAPPMPQPEQPTPSPLKYIIY